MQVLQAAAVDEHSIQIPEIDGRHIVGEDLLHIAVERLLLGPVGGSGRFGEQLVDLRIRVKAAIRTVGRKAGGCE